MKKSWLCCLSPVVSCTGTPADGQRPGKAEARPLPCLSPPALCNPSSLHALSSSRSCLSPKPIIRILLTDEETELGGKGVVTWVEGESPWRMLDTRWEIPSRDCFIYLYLSFRNTGQHSKFAKGSPSHLYPPTTQFFQEAIKRIHVLSIFLEIFYLHISRYMPPAFCLPSGHTCCSSFGLFYLRFVGFFTRESEKLPLSFYGCVVFSTHRWRRGSFLAMCCATKLHWIPCAYECVRRWDSWVTGTHAFELEHTDCQMPCRVVFMKWRPTGDAEGCFFLSCTVFSNVVTFAKVSLLLNLHFRPDQTPFPFGILRQLT